MAIGIVSGEQYPIPVVIRQGGTVYTPENIAKVRVKLGRFSSAFPDGDLEYSGNAWQFPMTQEMSYQFKSGTADLQVQVKDSHGNTYSSKITKITIDPTIFGGAW